VVEDAATIRALMVISLGDFIYANPPFRLSRVRGEETVKDRKMARLW
jgi:hypothetical protein